MSDGQQDEIAAAALAGSDGAGARPAGREQAHGDAGPRSSERLAAAENANREWESIFDAIADPICIVTGDYKLLRANAAYKHTFGEVPEGGSHYCFTARGGHNAGPCEQCPLPRTVHSGESGFIQQDWDVADGPEGEPRVRQYQRWTYPIAAADGSVVRVVEVLKDVTAYEQMRRSLALADALREADRLKAELLGTVSHELRSPLTAIKGYAATLVRHERHLAREERHDFLMSIVEASDRLEVLINRLLELSQLETGSITPHLEPVNVVQIAQEALRAAEQRVRGVSAMVTPLTFGLRIDGVTVRGDRETRLVDADPRLLRDVLDNLLENAIKYSPNGGEIEVLIASQAASDGDDARAGQRLEIVVRDTGVGIPAEHLGRVFDRFHRVDAGLTREVEGLGLGLAMCQRIVELHAGTIWVESTPGQGSAFHLELPVVARRVPVDALAP